MEIIFREARETDLPIMLAWRSNPIVYEGTYSKGPPTWRKHFKWWRTRNKDWQVWIVEVDDRPVGTYNICQLDNWNPEFGIYIGEVTLWGYGIGKAVLNQIIERLRADGITHTHTTVLDTNERAIRLLKSAGFKRTGDARKGESRYERAI